MICVYDASMTDFSTIGAGAILPTEATVQEKAGGKFSLTLKHPMDKTGKWYVLTEGSVIRCPAPVRETPLVQYLNDKALHESTQQTVTITRSIYRVRTNGGRLHLRTGPSTSYSIIGRYKRGTEVKELESSGNWRHVVVLTDGAEGWMSSGYLTYVRTVDDTVTQPSTSNPSEILDDQIETRQTRDQLFRITKTTRDSQRGMVTVEAQHIFYDLAGAIIKTDCEFENEPVQSAFTKLVGSLSHETPFHFYSMIREGTITGNYTGWNIIRALLDPDEGFVAQAKARIIRDNFDVFILPDVIRNRGVEIRHGKNLLGAQLGVDRSSVVTRIRPIGKDKDGNRLLITENDGFVESTRLNDYPIYYDQEIDYDVRVVDKDPDGESTFGSNDAAREALKQKANEDFQNGADLPEISLDVDFVLLENAAEYAEYAQLEVLQLYDSAKVIAAGAGIKSTSRMNEYAFDAIRKRYTRCALGDIQDLQQTVYGYQLSDGGVSGTKLVSGSVDGIKLRNLSIDYAKLKLAAIDQIQAGSISALEGRINDLTADTINTDSFAAAIAKIIALKVGTLTADSIKTDQLAAALAAFQVITAGSASFNAATVRHLISAALNVENTVSGEAFIKNLRVMYAQIVAATIGNLCIKASDGNYYRIDVNADGTVEATKTTVTESEISQGHTNAGRVILATEITAEDLSAANIYATYALVNKIDAARIDVGQLFAQQAFIDQLNTTDIRSNSFIQMMVGDATVWRVEIESSNADVLTDGSSTTLSARVYQGAIERTDDIPAARFRWRRSGDDPNADAVWNAAHRGMKSVIISGGDVRYNAVYSCDVLDAVELLTSDGNTLLDANNDTLTALEAS